MCGIAGVSGEVEEEKRFLEKMCDAIRHRGPDDCGYLVSDNIALGMRRLAIIDLKTGRQPIFNEDGTVAVVFNGEIYNFPELRRMLVAKGHRFSTNTDTECIVHLYEEFDDDCCLHLRGMFAFALWDAKRNRLLLARDRLGKKPLFYRKTDSALWFASELKCLIQDSAFNRSVDHIALHHYLTYQYVPQPWSIYEGISKVPPAHTLSYENGRSELKRYWALDFSSEAKSKISLEDAVDQLKELLIEAVRLRLVADRPIGAFLSGGIDSSIIVALMAQIAPGSVKTFSIGFEDSAYDETHFARMVADRFACDHNEYVVRPSAAEILPMLTWHYDEPFADSSAIPSYYLAEMTSGSVTVALTGDGGDENFAGYRRYRGGVLINGSGRIRHAAGAAPIASILSRLGKRGSSLAYLGRFLTALGERPDNAYASMISCFQNNQKQDIYSVDMKMQVGHVNSWSLLSNLFDSTRAENVVDQMLDVDIQTYLPDDLLTKMDIASMAHSLEARSPFLDHKVMEFSASLPAHMKIDGTAQKVILKRLGTTMLPRKVMDRRKMGFAVPIGKWLRSELKEMSEDLLLDNTARSRGYFEPAAVKELIRQHQSGSDHSGQIWSLLQFERWHRMFIDDRAFAKPDPIPHSAG